MQRLAIDRLETPCLLVDEPRMMRNIDRLRTRLDRLGATLRPHLKTCKSVEIARRLAPSAQGPATVSTLKEAEEFAAAGVRDIMYAVGLAPGKLDRVLALRRRGVDLAIIIDSREQAAAVAASSRAAGDRIPTLIEIDCDGHRADQGLVVPSCAVSSLTLAVRTTQSVSRRSSARLSRSGRVQSPPQRHCATRASLARSSALDRRRRRTLRAISPVSLKSARASMCSSISSWRASACAASMTSHSAC